LHAPLGVFARVGNPDIVPGRPAPVCLTIAGHTHSGQVVLPLLGRLIVPSNFGQRYAIGHIIEGSRHLFVTSGIGTSVIPVRLGVPLEIAC
jgi:predicted MPP superfamily phosphohydrolase